MPSTHNTNNARQRVVLLVSNDLAQDQRLHKVCLALQGAGYSPLLVGRLQRQSRALAPRPYATRRLRLWFQRGKGFYLALNIRLFWFLLFTKCDIITANDLDTLLAGYWAARLRGKKLVYDAHELFTEDPEVAMRPRVRRIWLALERWLVPKTKIRSTVNHLVANEYTKLYGPGWQVVMNCPPHTWQPPGPKPEPIFIYQGILKLGRGLELMLAAMPHVPEAQLWIVGNGTIENELKQMAHDLGIQRRVRFMGFIPFEALASYTKQARVGLSLEVPEYKNSLLSSPNKLFDYAQAGVPVIASHLPFHAQLVQEFGIGLVLQERSAQALATLMQRMIDDGDFYDACVANTQKAAAAYCWEAQTEALLGLYR